MSSNFKNNSKITKSSHKRAFTLVEMIVALGLFSIVAVVALGALVKIISANKKAQSLQASITNLNYALEAMSREMRVGRKYNLESPPAYGYDEELSVQADQVFSNNNLDNSASLAFISSKSDSRQDGSTCNLAHAYQFIKNDSETGWTLQKATQADCDSDIGADDFSDVIDPNVVITGYYLKVISDDDHPFPLATIRISGYAGVREREKTFFDVQTSVSARIK